MLISFCIAAIMLFSPNLTHAASNPYTVPNEVKTGWNKVSGDKTYNMDTGRNLVYDVYPSKYLSSGHQIVNRNFGKGSQPYLNFKGWAIIFGHYRHTASNQETYIVAKSGTTEKIYSTLQINISATEDGEYNNQGPNHVWNECPSTAKNKSNIDSWGGCNMRYDSVGFDAYIPLNELVPDPSVNASWQFYIVKKVNSYMVYAPLILPLDLSPLNFHSGKISLTSG